MSSLGPVTERARILYAALALQTFTSKDLADYSGVKLSTVRGQLLRDGLYFEPLEKTLRRGRGNSYKRYRLRESAQEELVRVLGTLSNEPSSGPEELPTPAEIEARIQESRERLSLALEAAKDSIGRAVSAPDTDERARWTRRARVQLSDAQSAVRWLPAESTDSEVVQLSQVRADVERLVASPWALGAEQDPLLEDPAPATEVRWSLDPKILDAVKLALIDWGAPLPHPTPDTDLTADADLESSLKRLLDEVLPQLVLLESTYGFLDVLVAPAALLCSRYDFGSERLKGPLQALLKRRLLSAQTRTDIREFAALAMLASLADIDNAVDRLFQATMTWLDVHVLTRHQREILFGAIARFARPGRQGDWKTAANHALTLVGRPDIARSDLPLLVCAAFRADMADAGTILLRFAMRTYDAAAPTEQGLGKVYECSVMLNLTTVLRPRRFAPLVSHMPTLVHEDYGVNFIKALTNDDYGAIALRDGDGKSYVLRLGETLVNRLKLEELDSVELPIEEGSKTGKALEHLMVRPKGVFTRRLAESGAAKLPQIKAKYRHVHDA